MKRLLSTYTLGTLCSVALLCGCSKDYLDTVPTDSIGASTVTATTQNAMAGLNGIARAMTAQHYWAGQGFCGENAIFRIQENYPSQDYFFNAYASGWADIHNMALMTSITSMYNYYTWYYYYQLLTNANTIILGIDNAEGEQSEKDYIKAAALTFRAYSYEKLLRYYSVRWLDSNNGASRGLPLRLDDSTGGVAFSTMAETYAQIYKDLDEAIKLFEGSSYSTDQVWIPNLNVAHAVYARAALNRLDYETAIQHARKATEGYPLMSQGDYKAGFATPTSEWIFGSYGDASENNYYWSYGTQYAANGYYSQAADTGAGQIAIDLIGRVPSSDVRNQIYLTKDKFPELDWNAIEADPNYQTYGLITEESAFPVIRAWLDSNTPSGFSKPYQAQYYFIGSHLKFFVTAQPGVSYLPFIRSAEMYLIEAEAQFKLGKEAEARKALTDLNVTRNPGYTTSKVGNDLWEEIVLYRTVELWGEGSSWSDFKRWKRPIVRKTVAQGGNCHPSTAITIQPEDKNNWTWVLPERESNYNELLKDKL